MAITFLPVAALLTITPGMATALVVKSAAVSGRREAFRVTVGNEVGVVVWALLAAAGVAAVVAASATAFTVMKVVCAGFLIVLGVKALLAREPVEEALARSGTGFRDGLVTSIANPKLAAFYVALFPQFVPTDAPVLPATLLMTAMIVALDFAWYSFLAAAVSRARRALMRTAWVERLTGAVLVGLGVRLAMESRP
jgi:threonine/homoserine/homoserine lactone efflux protein